VLLFVVHNLANGVAWLMKQEPEDEFPTKLVGYFLLVWFILSVALSVTLNKWGISPKKNMNCNPIISLKRPWLSRNSNVIYVLALGGKYTYLLHLDVLRSVVVTGLGDESTQYSNHNIIKNHAIQKQQSTLSIWQSQAIGLVVCRHNLTQTSLRGWNWVFLCTTKQDEYKVLSKSNVILRKGILVHEYG